MESIIGFLMFFGVVFAIVLLGMLVFMKFAHGRVEPSAEEKQKKARYMADAPEGEHGARGPG